jgi:hypothetical protein
MDGVQFSEEEGIQPRAASAPRASKAAAWLVARGVARTEKEANMMLLGGAIIVIILAAIIFVASLGTSGAPPVTDAERLRNELSTPPPKR